MINLGTTVLYRRAAFYGTVVARVQWIIGETWFGVVPLRAFCQPISKDAELKLSSVRWFEEQLLFVLQKKDMSFYLMDITVLQISDRIIHALKSAGINGVGDLVLKKENDLLLVHGIGRKAINEIKEMLARRELSLTLSRSSGSELVIRNNLAQVLYGDG